MTTARSWNWRRIATAVTLVGMLAGCGIFGSGTEYDPTVKMTPAEIYADAKENMSEARWSAAIKLLIKLESRYPFGVWSQQAQLDTAYCQYRDNEHIQALVSIERFIRLYPTSAQLDYAFYLKGLINFNEDMGLLSGLGGQDLSERDQKAARESFEAFRQVVVRFPNSIYTADARARMQYLINAMAGSEVHIARYYFIRGAYLAAINRAQGVILQYQGAPAIEEALFIVMKGSEQLGLDQQRADAERVLLLNFPKTPLLATGLKLDDRSWWEVWR